MPLAVVVGVVALIFGAALGYWIRHQSVRAEILAEKQKSESLESQIVRREASLTQALKETGELREAKARLDAENSQLAELRKSIQQFETERRIANEQIANLREQVARLSTELQGLQTTASEKLEFVASTREELSNQFKSLATDILEEKSKRFTEQNRENIGNLLNPLKEKFGEFQEKVASLEKDSIQGRTELREQINNLTTLNERLSQDANNLVQALKGSSKTQGDWGELLLEQLLEAAGLHKGQEYRVQESFTREDNSRARVDVILNLPEGRHLIIDSKVSLNDYDDYCRSDEEAARESALKRHLASMRSHIKELSQREYQTLYGLNSIDFVIMFVPIEPAFMLAMASEGKLWQEGWDKNVLLVSRTTLLFVLRTVAHLWRQEQQTRNVQEIVRRGGELYEKLVAFIADLTNVGKKLDAARESYDEAFKKLHTGRGSVIWRAEKLRDLGIRPAKSIPATLVEAALNTPDVLTAPLFDEPEANGIDEAE
jgi:DNA recombination protein RmuC